MVPIEGEFLAIFCVLHFQRAACSTLQSSDLQAAFYIRTRTPPCVEVW